LTLAAASSKIRRDPGEAGLPREEIPMKKCPNQEENKKDCPCTYEPCERKGVCCECIQYHRRTKSKPACMR
jgi:hypothetical protein